MLRSRSVFVSAALPALLVALAVASVGESFVASALAQPPAKPAPKAFEPFVIVVTGDKVPMLCMAADNGYTVSELPRNSVLRVIDETSGFYKVQYPPKMTAFARAGDVEKIGDTVRVNKPTKLWAANPLRGFEGSWKALMDTPLASGTMLSVVDIVNGTDGKAQAYRVVAPAGASGFVDSKSVRRATDQEASALGAAPSSTSQPSDPTAKPVADAGQPAAQPTNLTQPISGTGTAPKVDAPTHDPSSIMPRPTEDRTPPGTTPASGGTTSSTTSGSALPTKVTPQPMSQPGAGGTSPAGQTPGQPPVMQPEIDVTPNPAAVAAVEARKRRAADLETLEAKFQAVSRQPQADAEYDEIAAELRRAIEQEAPESRRAKQLQARLDFITLKRDVRDRIRAAEDARASIDATNVQVQREMAAIEATRVYNMIGTLAPSTVYDGGQLPLMYRIQSVGGVSPRTLGYVKPSKDFDLDRKLGQVVGIIGTSEMDRALKLNIITPVRVDTLKASAYSTFAPGVAVPQRDGQVQPSNPANTAPGNPPAQPQMPTPTPAPTQPQVPDPTDK